MTENATYHKDIVIVKVHGNGQLRSNELDELDALFPVHGLV